jgi:hypothetical protein
MYGVEFSLWVRVASMHFEGTAARWLQSVEHWVKYAGWAEFCARIHDHFGQDQHDTLIHQLFHIRQVGTVVEYVEQFSALVDQLAPYESDSNPLYYAMRFVDGLRDEIRSMVMIQCPATLESACALALVQEAEDSVKKKEYIRYEPSSNRMAHKFAYLLPPPPKVDKPGGAFGANDRCTIEATRANSVDDKVHALKQHRRARGLCYRCAERWTYGHQCASTVQLHVIQELWELLPEEDQLSVGSVEDVNAQLCMCLSAAVMAGTNSAKSMRLLGSMQGKEILILVDSGSSHTFVSTMLVGGFQGISKLSVPISV